MGRTSGTTLRMQTASYAQVDASWDTVSYYSSRQMVEQKK